MMDTHKRTLSLNSIKFSILNSSPRKKSNSSEKKKLTYILISLLGEKLTCDQVLTKDSVTVSVDAVVYYRCNQLCHRAVTYFSTRDDDDVVSFPDPLFKWGGEHVLWWCCCLMKLLTINLITIVVIIITISRQSVKRYDQCGECWELPSLDETSCPSKTTTILPIFLPKYQSRHHHHPSASSSPACQ